MGICPSSYATRRGVHRVAGLTKARLHANPAAFLVRQYMRFAFTLQRKSDSYPPILAR